MQTSNIHLFVVATVYFLIPNPMRKFAVCKCLFILSKQCYIKLKLVWFAKWNHIRNIIIILKGPTSVLILPCTELLVHKQEMYMGCHASRFWKIKQMWSHLSIEFVTRQTVVQSIRSNRWRCNCKMAGWRGNFTSYEKRLWSSQMA